MLVGMEMHAGDIINETSLNPNRKTSLQTQADKEFYSNYEKTARRYIEYGRNERKERKKKEKS